MQHENEVILNEDYQTSIVVLDSTAKGTICEDLEVCWGDGGKGLCGGIREASPMGNGSCSYEVLDLKPWD